MSLKAGVSFETSLAMTGEFVLGIDFGDNFAQLQSFQFSYTFYYMVNGYTNNGTI